MFANILVMKKNMKNFLPICLTFLLLAACGGDNDDDNGDNTPQLESTMDFSTRLSPTLLISGTRCEGGETTIIEGRNYTCDLNEWLIFIDNVNTCTNDGSICTEIGVEPIIAELDEVSVGLYDIDPETPVTPAQAQAISQVRIKVELNGDTQAIYR